MFDVSLASRALVPKGTGVFYLRAWPKIFSVMRVKKMSGKMFSENPDEEGLISPAIYYITNFWLRKEFLIVMLNT